MCDKNITVSGTKLMLGLRVGFICSHLTEDKLFPVNPKTNSGPPKMSLLLEAKSMPAFIIKLRLIIKWSDDAKRIINAASLRLGILRRPWWVFHD